MNYDLGFVDLEEKTLQPLQNPFGPKLYFSGTDNGKGWLWGDLTTDLLVMSPRKAGMQQYKTRVGGSPKSCNER